MPDEEAFRKLEELADNVVEEALAIKLYVAAVLARDEREADGRD